MEDNKGNTLESAKPEVNGNVTEEVKPSQNRRPNNNHNRNNNNSGKP